MAKKAYSVWADDRRPHRPPYPLHCRAAPFQSHKVSSFPSCVCGGFLGVGLVIRVMAMV